MQQRLFAIFLLLMTGCTGSSEVSSQTASVMPYAELAALDQPEPDYKIAYGDDPLQYGRLTLPKGPGPHPVMVLIHGGCWLAQYDIEHTGLLAKALTDEGFATWSIEYRRVGNRGGGWPGTFRDVAMGADYVRDLSKDYPVDASRVYAIGHSAGGQLALWLAARPRLPADGELYEADAVPIRGVIGLAAVPQLEAAHEARVCGHVIDQLLGGSPETVPRRYAQTSPAKMLPLGVPQILINGAHDTSWYQYGEDYYKRAKAAGDDVQFIIAPDAGHFELIVPTTSTWPIVRKAARSFLAGTAP